MRDAFDALVADACACRACPAMDGQPRVISRANGPVPARIMLVGEAPGRRGAALTGVPFAGDESGRRLDRLLAAAGWRRADVFITNAVLCNPLGAAGRNRRPGANEVRACRNWLTEQVDIVAPMLVVGLGAVALDALRGVEAHALRVSDAGSAPVAWRGCWLAAAYHPGARAAIHRSVAAQWRDFERLGAWARARTGGGTAIDP